MKQATVRLIVGVDQVGMLRSSRGHREPDPVHFALQAELAGAGGIRAHLRIDQRHISEEDAGLLNRQVKTRFYLQASPHQDILHLVNGLRPQNLILAAERRDERATDAGLDAVLLAGELKGLINNIDERQTRVFLFVDPALDQIKVAAKLNAAGVVINTREAMLDRTTPSDRRLIRVREAVRLAAKLGLETHLSGGIDFEHLPELAAVEGVAAVHLGHQLVARALLLGVEQAVRDACRRIIEESP